MDAQLRRLERTARALPGDPSRFLAHARELRRAGRVEDAREVVRERLRRRRVDAAGLSLLCELSRESELLGPERLAPARPRVVRRVREPGALRPVIAFVGAQGADSSAHLCELAGAFEVEPRPAEACQLNSSYVAYGEHVLDVGVRLAEPWRVSPGFEADSVRLLCLPRDPGSGKFRRELLRDVSALVVLVPKGCADAELKEVVGALDRDQRRATGVGLDELPVLLRYEDPAAARGHPLRAAALGLSEASWVVGAEEQVTALAWLLRELGRGVEQGLVRPRSR